MRTPLSRFDIALTCIVLLAAGCSERRMPTSPDEVYVQEDRVGTAAGASCASCCSASDCPSSAHGLDATRAPGTAWSR